MKIIVSRLLFGICLLIMFKGCGRRDSEAPIELKWSAGKAVGLSIDKSILKNIAEDSISHLVKVRWAGSEEDLFMLGAYGSESDRILFTPVIPFTRRLRYEVIYRGAVVGELEVPADARSPAPSVLAVYPSQDTVPENLLKMYIQFSQPMSEGRSLDHVILLRNKRDTMKGTFLDLQPELWNEDGTVLTLWLDPGRIKRDLIPNKQLGIPLMQGQSYTFYISPKWKSKEGSTLGEGHIKTFFVTRRDKGMPDIDHWRIGIPHAGNGEPLTVEFGEPLDFSLIHSAISVANEKGEVIRGAFTTLHEEVGFTFMPSQKWDHGKYTLQIESRIEDLAGNNLNRLFDTDVTVSENKRSEKEVFEKKFEIKVN